MMRPTPIDRITRYDYNRTNHKKLKPAEVRRGSTQLTSGKGAFYGRDPNKSSIKITIIFMRIFKIMKDYSDFPPFRYFTRVLKSCPKSALLYAQIWDKKGLNMSFVIEKKEVQKDYLISPTVFRNLLVSLMFLNLVHFKEDDGEFHIDVLGSPSNE